LLTLWQKSARFGLGIINRINGTWFKGSDPFNALMWDDVVSRFKELYNDGKSGYLEGILEKYFINRPTFAFTMTPDPDYDAKLAAEEAKRLESEIAKKNLGEETVQKLGEEELALLKEQEAARTQPLDVLPTVHVKDIQRSLDRKEIEHDTKNGVKIQWRKAPTNGLTYFKGTIYPKKYIMLDC
jgi:presequence protease